MKPPGFLYPEIEFNKTNTPMVVNIYLSAHDNSKIDLWYTSFAKLNIEG